MRGARKSCLPRVWTRENGMLVVKLDGTKLVLGVIRKFDISHHVIPWLGTVEPERAYADISIQTDLSTLVRRRKAKR